MSNVIVFEPDRTEKALASPDFGTAQILFFTGVRYVRDLDIAEVVAPEDAASLRPAIELADHPRTERLQA